MRYIVNEDYFKTWTPNMAYVFGLWCADGCIYKNNFNITLKKQDSYLLSLIKKDMKSERPIEHRIYCITNGDVHTTCSLTVSNQTIIEDLMNLGGTPRKSLTLKLPNVPKEYFPHFIRGVFDGDGTISKNNKNSWNVGIYSGSKVFLEEIQKTLQEEIINFKSKIHPSRKIFFLRFSSNSAKLFGNYIYDNDCLLFLHRKYEKFLEMGNEINLSLLDLCKNDSTSEQTKAELIRRLSEGQTVTHIAKDFNTRSQNVTNALRYFNIDWKKYKGIRKYKNYSWKTTNKKLENLTKEGLIKRLSEGQSLRFIASEHEVDHMTIALRCEKWGINRKDYEEVHKMKRYSWDSNRLEKITKEKLVAMLSEGQSLIYIGEHFGVSDGTIRSCCEKFDINYKELGKDKKEKFRQCRFKNKGKSLLT